MEIEPQGRESSRSLLSIRIVLAQSTESEEEEEEEWKYTPFENQRTSAFCFVQQTDPSGLACVERSLRFVGLFASLNGIYAPRSKNGTAALARISFCSLSEIYRGRPAAVPSGENTRAQHELVPTGSEYPMTGGHRRQSRCGRRRWLRRLVIGRAGWT